MDPIPAWYAASQAIICLSAVPVFLVIWKRMKPVDPCWFWLGMAVLAWGVLGLGLLWPFRTATPRMIACVRMPSSTFNSGCFLLAAAYLDYGPFRLRFLQEQRRRRLAVFATTGAVAAVTLALTLWRAPADWESHAAWTFTWWSGLDVALSLFTIAVLGRGLFTSFEARRLEPLAYVAAAVFLFQAFAQLPELFPRLLGGDARWVLLLTSKTAVVIVFLSLVISSLFEKWALPPAPGMHLVLEEEGRPPLEARLEFTERRAGRRSAVRLTIPGKCEDRDVYLSPRMRELLTAAAKAVLAEKAGKVEQDLYIPLDAGEVWRLVKQIEAQIDASLEVNDLFANNYQGGYRLRVPWNQISLRRGPG